MSGEMQKNIMNLPKLLVHFES